jgi:hypothetical protein
MGKKNGLVLLVLMLLLAGGFFYWRHSHIAPREGRVRSTFPPPETSPHVHLDSVVTPPATGAASGDRKDAIVAPPEASFHPRSGETLEFAANVPKLNSTLAKLTIAIVERRNLDSKSSWHLQAFAHTENPYRMVFELDDQFDSYSETATLTSLQYEMHLSERGQKADSVQRLLPSARDTAPAGVAAARVLPGTRDPLGMLLFLRGTDWNKTQEVHSPIYDGRKLYDVRATLAGRGQQVIVPAGKFTVSKIEIHVFENGAEMKDAHFLLYLVDDPSRTPVLLEAVLPFATARVELLKAG